MKFLNKVLKLFKSKDKTLCPKCGGKLCQPQCTNNLVLLGSYNPVITICENHKDGETFKLKGNKTCDYGRGHKKPPSRAMIALPANMRICSDDMIGYKYNAGSTFYIEPARMHTEVIGKALWELHDQNSNKEIYLAFRWYGETK